MVEIRKATRRDGEKAWEIRTKAILAECSSYYPIEDLKVWTDGDISEEFLNDVESYFYVAEIGSEIAGTGKVSLDKGIIDAIFVDPEHMGKGIATNILTFLENVARENGVEILKLESTLNAADFYRNRGFVGNEIAQYKSPRGIELACIPMAKTIA